MLVDTRYRLRVEGQLFAAWCHENSFLPRTTPLFGVLQRTPLVGTAWFLHSSSKHFQWDFKVGGRLLDPLGRNGEMSIHVVINITPAIERRVVDEY